jgi:hypothetical protein
VKSSTDSPSLNRMLSNLAHSRYVLAFRTASLPIRRDLTTSHASVVLFFTTSDASISYGTAPVIASSTMRSSYSVTSPISMASQRFLACSLVC